MLEGIILNLKFRNRGNITKTVSKLVCIIQLNIVTVKIYNFFDNQNLTSNGLMIKHPIDLKFFVKVFFSKNYIQIANFKIKKE